MKLTLNDAGWFCLGVALAILVGIVCALFSHWLTLVFSRIGATEPPAAYLAYIITFLLLVFAVTGVMNRINPGRRGE